MSDLFPLSPATLPLFTDAEPTLVRVIDTETAGQRLEEDAVLEIGSVDLDLATGAIFNPLQSLVDPGGVEINPHARRVHQISDEMLNGAPSFDDAVQAFAGAPAYAAQRSSFDRPRLKLSGRWLCTYKLALRAFPQVKAHGLQSLVKYVPLDLSEVQPLMAGLHPHRALYDAVCTAVLLRQIAAVFLPRCSGVEDFLDRAERVSNQPALLARLRFGKHKGVPFGDLPVDYLQWLVAEPNMDADAVFTARHHLSVLKVRGARPLVAAAR